MPTHRVGTGQEWLAGRLRLLDAEKALTRQGDELAQRRREPPWVRIDQDYRFDTDDRHEAPNLQGRMGWTFRWPSSGTTSFNYDFQAALTEEEQRSGAAECNFRVSDTRPPPDTG